MAIAGLAVVVLAGCQYGEADGVSEVTDISARMHGTVHSSDPLPEYWFEYDDEPHLVEGVGLIFDASTEHGQWACCGPMETASGVATGLTPDTTYQYRFCIRNEDGRGLCGAPASFQTKPDDRDVVSGSIWTPPSIPIAPSTGIAASVRADPDGSNPVGQVTVSPGSYDFRLPDTGDATCLRIVGNRVAIGFVVVDQFETGVGDIAKVAFVEDNGASGDRWGQVTVAAAPLTCPDPSTAVVSWQTPTTGDITITDR